MFQFEVDPNWYEKTWLTPDRPRRVRRRVGAALVGVACVMVALASVTVLQPTPSVPTMVEMIG